MKSRIVTVHYCDHCKRRKFFRKAMERHERGCTMNPNRHCRMCEINDTEQKPIQSAAPILLKYSFDQDCDESARFVIASLKKHFNDCPACTLAALRQIPNELPCSAFNFKESVKAWWDWQRELRPEDFGITGY